MLGCALTKFCMQALFHSSFQAGYSRGKIMSSMGTASIRAFELSCLISPSDMCFIKICPSPHLLTFTILYIDKPLSHLQRKKKSIYFFSESL